MVRVNGRRERRHKQLPDDFEETILETEIGSTISHSGENSLWTTLWAHRKTEYGMNFPINHQNFTSKAGGVSGYSPHKKEKKKKLEKYFVDPMTSNPSSDLLFSPNQLLKSAAE
jgi:hypothetical protein